MDVVRRNIDALRGRIEIHTEPGEGTTFLIKLPLTLAILDGLLLRRRRAALRAADLLRARIAAADAANRCIRSRAGAASCRCATRCCR